MIRATVLSAAMLFAVGAARQAVPPSAPVSPPSVSSAPSAAPADLATTIANLGSFDDAARAAAAHALRRLPEATVVPALDAAARGHHDEYVRYRALVLLSGFGGARANDAMRDLVGDRDDRIRTVVYEWFERHPSPAVLPALIAALDTERSEFVRPALTRAIAAYGSDPRARVALAPLVMRGEDLFRGSLIVALGDYDGRYALDDIVAVAKTDGPLQDDAITAIGMMGDPSTQPVLAALQKTAPREEQPTIGASLCLMGFQCDAEMAYLKQTIAFGVKTDAYQPLLRGTTHALGVLAVRGHQDALDVLLDTGVATSSDEARAPIALAVGFVALRKPDIVIDAVQARLSNVAPVVAIVRDAFDMLSTEDFGEEQFYVAVRAAYWDAPEHSARRQAAEALLDGLEF